jgi:hypothetical protein
VIEDKIIVTTDDGAIIVWNASDIARRSEIKYFNKFAVSTEDEKFLQTPKAKDIHRQKSTKTFINAEPSAQPVKFSKAAMKLKNFSQSSPASATTSNLITKSKNLLGK